MKKKVYPAKLSKNQISLIKLLIKLDKLDWSGKIKIGKVDYTESRDDMKEDIRLFLMLEQDFYCAYCGLRILESTPLIEHIADKSKEAYKKEMFNPLNLVLACLRCNNDRKKTRNSVFESNGPYQKWKFLIIHPILDEPSDHIEFDPDFIFITKIKTEKGNLTVSWFELNSPVMVEARIKQYLFKDFIANNIEQDMIEKTLLIPKFKK